MRLPVPIYEQQEFAVNFARPGIDVTSVSTSVVNQSDNSEVDSGSATEKDEDQFVYTVGPFETMGEYDLVWTADTGLQQTTYFEVVEQMPVFSQLTDTEKSVVIGVYDRVSNTFDSTSGGPYLFELSHNKNRHVFEIIADRLIDSLNLINFGYPPTFKPPYEVGWAATKRFPEGWHGLLGYGAYVEFLKHLSRSYIEQPDVQGMNVGRLDRSKYRDEWRREYEMEREELKNMIQMFKRQFVGRSDRALLLGGMNISAGIPSRPAFRMLRYI